MSQLFESGGHSIGASASASVLPMKIQESPGDTVESENHSVVPNSVTPWTIQSMDFFSPEYWSGLPLLSPIDRYVDR